MSLNERLAYSTEVEDALGSGAPIVALESTIIAHGMPYPKNLEVAQMLEQLIREEEAVPATIGVWEGKLQVGMSQEQLEALAWNGPVIPKVSRRDLPVMLARGGTGATTVAATMIIAHQAGISCFATGGIGGVHRGAERTMDISADLQELAKTPVIVVSAGAKAILDLQLTLEYLETMGVPVLGYRTTEFPSFYSRSSGLKIGWSTTGSDEIAAIFNEQRRLEYPGGLLVANPIPEAFELDFSEMDEQIGIAIQAAAEEGIKGKALTPFLLSRLETLSAGKSLEANVALVKNNVCLASRIARALNPLNR